MTRLAPALLALLAALPASAQIAAEPGIGGDSCAEYLAMEGYDARIAALSAIQPLGDEINATDDGIAHQWADQVAGACEGHPDRSLADAAAAALND